MRPHAEPELVARQLEPLIELESLELDVNGVELELSTLVDLLEVVRGARFCSERAYFWTSPSQRGSGCSRG